MNQCNDDTFGKFIKELQEWIDSDFPTHDVFSESLAICTTCYWWYLDNYGSDFSEDSVDGYLKRLFTSEGLCHIYPFNEDNKNFAEECRYGTFYKNSKRLSWVKEKANA